MNSTPSLMKTLLQYSKERFPIPGVVLYAGTLFLLPYFFAGLFPGARAASVGDALAGFAILFLVFLHLRVFDEHKDAEKDAAAYPDRMLSKGLITLADLRAVLTAVLFMEFGLSVFLGFSAFVTWFAVLLWSLLMFVEFFAPRFLNRRLGLYLVSHQLIVPLVCLFAVSIRVPLEGLGGIGAGTITLFCLATMLATITYEIGRKTWSADREHAEADSYTKVWGVRGTVAAGQIAALAATVIFIAFFDRFTRPCVYAGVAVLLNLIFLAAGVLFVIKPEHRFSKAVEAAGILFMLGMFLNGIVAFY